MRKDQDDDKKVIGAKTNAAEAIFGIFENETANSFFQRILATSTDDIGKLIYNIPIIIYAIAKNQYIYVNSTFEKTLGYTLVQCNICSFVYMINMIPWRKTTYGGCHVAKISSHLNEGGT